MMPEPSITDTVLEVLGLGISIGLTLNFSAYLIGWLCSADRMVWRAVSR